MFRAWWHRSRLRQWRRHCRIRRWCGKRGHFKRVWPFKCKRCGEGWPPESVEQIRTQWTGLQ